MRAQRVAIAVAVVLAAVSVGFADTRCDWATQLLSGIGMGASQNRMTAMLGWMQGEGSPCANNPLDTTEGWSGATDCNGAGVKNYDSESDGVSATVATLTNGYYQKVLDEFGADEDPITIAEAIVASPWGTQDAVGATQYCQDNYDACCNTEVVG